LALYLVNAVQRFQRLISTVSQSNAKYKCHLV
jgi:hypothetical protein